VKGSEPLLFKIISGVTAGSIGSAIANPTDLVKIRLQAESGKIDPLMGIYTTGLFKGKKPTYSSTFNAFYKTFVNEGLINGLYRGTSATVVRASLLTGTQLSSYDEIKYLFKSKGILDEGFSLHILASIFSGIVHRLLGRRLFLKKFFDRFNNNHCCRTC
jgi:hypothetical protein